MGVEPADEAACQHGGMNAFSPLPGPEQQVPHQRAEADDAQPLFAARTQLAGPRSPAGFIGEHEYIAMQEKQLYREDLRDSQSAQEPGRRR